MPRSCIAALLHALNHIMTSVPHNHPAALPVALWMLDRDDLFETVPQSWDSSSVDPTIWRALSRLVAGKAALSTPSPRFTVQQQAEITGLDELTTTEAEILAFLVACAKCDDLATLVEILWEGTGLALVDVTALCVGVTAAEVNAVLMGRLCEAGSITDGRASEAILLDT